MNKVNKIVATRSFERSIKKLQKKHNSKALKEIYEVVKDLANFKITKQKDNHTLQNARGHKDIHISGGDLVLLYRYDSSDDNDVVLVIDLRLQDVVNHDQLKHYDKYDAPAEEYDAENIKSSTDFLSWYDNLDEAAQSAVDDIADRHGVPLYMDASEDELIWLKDEYENNYIQAAEDTQSEEVENDEVTTDQKPVESSVDVVDSNSLQQQIYNKVIEVMQSPDFGFEEADAEEYTHVEVYEGLEKLCDACDPIVQQYNEDAYFEPVTPGIAEAWIWNDSVDATTSIESGLDPFMNPPTEETVTDKVKVVIPLENVEVIVDDKGFWDFGDDISWANVDLDDEEYPRDILERRDLLQDCHDVLDSYMPDTPGTYHIVGNVELIYIKETEYDGDTSSTDVTFDDHASIVTKFNIKK